MIDTRMCASCYSMNLKVIDSRKKDSGCTTRRLKCLDCGVRFTTFEIHEDDYRRLVEGYRDNSVIAASRKDVDDMNSMIGSIKENLTKFILDKFKVDISD